MEKNQMFGLYLPDPIAPFYNPNVAFYVGTQEELLAFADRVEDSSKASYYEDVIGAVRAYPNDSEARYKIAGGEYDAMVPVTEIGRKEFSLSDHTWIHKVPGSNHQYVMNANYIWVSYVIIKVANHRFVTCCKAQFEGLGMSVPGVGWIALGNGPEGTPGLFYHDEDNKAETHMSLYRSTRWHSSDEKAPTVENLPGPLRADLSTVIAELVGHC